VAADTLAQVQAGADVLDVNAGIPLVDEADLLARCCDLVQDTAASRSASTPR
jgi:5-methyltetrahydrofolate--homocysteine methyltransferase